MRDFRSVEHNPSSTSGRQPNERPAQRRLADAVAAQHRCDGPRGHVHGDPLQHVAATYYGESHVLQGVTMHVAPGTVTAVLGRNGVGKTTLCRSLVGLTPARAGRIMLNGTEITHLSP